MRFKIEDRLIAFLPDGLLVQHCSRDGLASQDIRMYTDDEYLLVIRPVEDADPAAFWETQCRTPKKIVIQFRGAGMFEAEDLAALGIDARHHMANDAVFAGGIHSLKYQQQGVPIVGIVLELQGTELFDMLLEKFPIMFLGFVERRDLGGPFLQPHFVPFIYAEGRAIDFH